MYFYFSLPPWFSFSNWNFSSFKKSLISKRKKRFLPVSRFKRFYVDLRLWTSYVLKYPIKKINSSQKGETMDYL